MNEQMSIFDFPECLPNEICSMCVFEECCRHNKDHEKCDIRADKSWNTSEVPNDREVHTIEWNGADYLLSTTKEPIGGIVVAWKDLQEWEKE